MRRYMAAAALVAASSALGAQRAAQGTLPNYTYTVVKTYPHDRRAFTQGLQYLDGVLYEGTGLNGASTIRKVNFETGEVLQQRGLAKEHFGEGITAWKSELFQLTWQSGLAFVYDRQTFEPKRTYRYSGEGWGLTANTNGFVMSDGTDVLRFLDPATFTERRQVKVTALGQPVRNLNELEFVKGEVLANIWMTDVVARIDPVSGKVTGWIDLSGLLTRAEQAAADAAGGVLNGIAYDAAGDRLFVTGKLWPKLFEIKLRPK